MGKDPPIAVQTEQQFAGVRLGRETCEPIPVIGLENEDNHAESEIAAHSRAFSVLVSMPNPLFFM
jgi:hypothetical protein